MRECDRGFDFEKPPVIDKSFLQRTEKEGLISDLKGVRVYALGVSTIGKTQNYWASLKNYWQEYFKKAGADLKIFTMERRFSYE